MSDRLDDCYGTYRCPVCGRRETTAIEAGQPQAVVPCRHCSTSLIIRRRGADSVRFSAQVAGQHAAN